MESQEFGDKLRIIRAQIPPGLTQLEFAGLVGWNRERIKRMELGMQRYKDHYLELIKTGLKKKGYILNETWFLNGEGDIFLKNEVPERASTLTTRYEPSAICPSCDFGVYISEDPQKKFCSYCGSKLITRCQKCNGVIDLPGQLFCSYCGHRNRQ